MLPDYFIYSEMPDGDKKLLFTCSRHFILCNCCGCSDCCPEYCQGWCNYCLCCGYLFSDIIPFQMDYKRNNRFFYIQGLSLPKGCYFCKLVCCCCCQCLPKSLDLKKNTNPKFQAQEKIRDILKLEIVVAVVVVVVAVIVIANNVVIYMLLIQVKKEISILLWDLHAFVVVAISMIVGLVAVVVFVVIAVNVLI